MCYQYILNLSLVYYYYHKSRFSVQLISHAILLRSSCRSSSSSAHHPLRLPLPSRSIRSTCHIDSIILIIVIIYISIMYYYILSSLLYTARATVFHPIPIILSMIYLIGFTAVAELFACTQYICIYIYCSRHIMCYTYIQVRTGII